MPRLWLINQFANTPDLPGHTRQYEVAAGLTKSGWKIHVFSFSEFACIFTCDADVVLSYFIYLSGQDIVTEHESIANFHILWKLFKRDANSCTVTFNLGITHDLQVLIKLYVDWVFCF